MFNEEKLDQGEAHRFLDSVLRQIEDELFDLGSELATPPDFSKEGMYRVGEREVKKLEQVMDECQKELEPLKSFVLPGGAGLAPIYINVALFVGEPSGRFSGFPASKD